MRLPNSYGSVVRLRGKRRKPYAVRISAGYKERICVPNKAEYYPVAIDKYQMQYRKAKNDYVMYVENDEVKEYFDQVGIPYRIEFVRKRKYINFFTKAADAYAYLAQMNCGEAVKEHVSIASEPSFKDVYDRYVEFSKTLKKKPSQTTLRADETGFKLFKDVHDIRFKAVTTEQLQYCLTAHNDLSKSSINRMGTILKKMYKYAIGNQICDTDLSQYLFKEYSDEKKVIHRVYTDEEIQYLWDHSSLESAKIALIYIYTGMRCSELLELKTNNIHLDERYIIGGIKSAAGRNRVIPIHKKIEPVIREMYNPSSKLFYPNSVGHKFSYQHFRDKRWNPWKKELGLDHYTHDARHTCASKLEAAGVPLLHQKLILGHTIKDITQGTYTHVARETLIEDMDKWT